jgi:hypothetical protein
MMQQCESLNSNLYISFKEYMEFRDDEKKSDFCEIPDKT